MRGAPRRMGGRPGEGADGNQWKSAEGEGSLKERRRESVEKRKEAWTHGKKRRSVSMWTGGSGCMLQNLGLARQCKPGVPQSTDGRLRKGVRKYIQ
jgi:hypothetical protein